MPPLELVKLEEAHTLYFDGAYKRTIDKAEYAALILGLEWCVNHKIHRLNVYGDAMLLIKQIKGIWACKNHNLLNHLRQVKELMHHFEVVEIHHVPRVENQEADALASEQHLREVVIKAIVLKEPLF
ncbi:hypothetical protein L7F22_065190 [Adiantum nelumboides]|nr:hypothetical protein [Adiantum nelumboides]